MVPNYECPFGHAGAAGADESAPGSSGSQDIELSKITGPLERVFASYSPKDLTYIEGLCNAAGIEISSFNFIDGAGVEPIKESLGNILSIPREDRKTVKEALEGLKKIIWENTEIV